MGVLIKLKPDEFLVAGNALIQNAERPSKFFIRTKVPILRHEYIMAPEAADTPAKKVYLQIQLMYVGGDDAPYHAEYLDLVRKFASSNPRSLPVINELNSHVLIGEFFKALGCARKLMDFEQSTSPSLPETVARSEPQPARQPLVVVRTPRRSVAT